ncbi:glycerophosphodiester phosphodiesterase [Mesobacillus foraminis]|uniref:Glycerophosphoryl diester phosphodiesterase n=1 Tax=Mesobacillus foraminis TaxID=279826 RepID=A0A4R2BNI2_9BACI|nr:glycerophosphodiester phosphodiesterase family protein [Mesobacillus foraminis]TCN27749.1 glycerophosphoryl diester phosphodiesterase [Mesobacillus foraminis]
MYFLRQLNRFLHVYLSILRHLHLPLAFLTGKKDRPIFIGHRGASGYYPENTILAFDKAVALGADMLEFDVQQTKDGTLIVIHDPKVNRTTSGKGYIKNLTYEEIKVLDAGSWFDPRFKGERIPTLDAVLDRYLGKVRLLIELKKPSLYPDIERHLAEKLRERGADQLGDGQIIVQSFDRRSMQEFHRIFPAVPVGVLIKNRPAGISPREIRGIAQYASYLNPKVTLVNKRLIKRIHGCGMKTFAWTVRDKKTAGALLKMGMDGIATDYLDYLTKPGPIEKDRGR